MVVEEAMRKNGHILNLIPMRFGTIFKYKGRLEETLDKDYSKTVKEAFLHYHKKGLIYQGERTINWCTRCGTSLSDLEI